MFEDSRPAAIFALVATAAAVSICLNPESAAPRHAAAAREPDAATVPDFKTATGLENPESALVAPNGTIYVSVIGEFDKAGDGKIVTLDAETAAASDHTTGLDDPKGLALVGDSLFVADVNRVCKITEPAKFEVFAAREAFDPAPKFLNDLVADAAGNLYVSDSGDGTGAGSVVFKITPDGKVSKLLDSTTAPLAGANGLALEDATRLLVLNFASGDLLRVDLTTQKATKINGGFEGGDGLAFDPQKRLVVSDWQNGRVWVLNSPEAKSDPVGQGVFDSAADSSVTRDGRFAVIPDMRAGKVIWLPLP